MEKKAKLSKKVFWAWPTRGIGLTILTVLAGYTTFFATDYLGIMPATAGIIFMISKIFDGFTDIIAGAIIDKVNLKAGKGRPFDLALIGMAVCNALLFSAPEMNYMASCAYLFIMYTMINSIFLTLLNCSEPVYMANVVVDSNDSVSLSSINGVASLSIGVVAGVVLPQMIKTMGTTRAGWRKIGWIIALVSIVIGSIRFFVVKETKRTTTQAEKFTPAAILKTITGNKYILLLSAIIFCGNVGNGLATNTGVYYAQYIIGDIGAQSILSLGALGVVFGLILVPVFSKKFGLIKVIKATTVLGMIGYLLRLLNPTSVGITFLSTLLGGFGFTIMFSFTTAIVVDCMDYGEWKTGVRREGILSCAQSVTAKIGTAVGVGLVGVLMGAAGYQGALNVQPNSANVMIIALSAVVPAVFCLIQLILLHFYDLDQKITGIRAELAKK